MAIRNGSSVNSGQAFLGEGENGEEENLQKQVDQNSVIQSPTASTISSRTSGSRRVFNEMATGSSRNSSRHARYKNHNNRTHLNHIRTRRRGNNGEFFPGEESNDDDDSSDEILLRPEGMQVNIPNHVQPNLIEDRDTHEGDDPKKRELNLIEVYSQGVIEPPEETTRITIMNCVRSTIVPNVKFLTSSKAFGSFEQPNFANSECWVNKLFANIPTLARLSDGTKARTWMTYKAKIREQFSLHRSGVTLKIKRKFMEGK